MRLLLRSFFLILVFNVALISRVVAIESVSISEEADIFNVGKQAEYFIDQEGELGFQEIRKKAESGQFKKSDQDLINFGYSHATYWIRFRIESSPSDNRSMIMDIDRFWINDIAVFIQKMDGTVLIKKAGLKYPFFQREIVHDTFAFEMPSLNDIHEIYISVSDPRDLLEIPITISSSKSFFEKAASHRLVEGVYLGLMVMLILHAVIAFIMTKEQTYPSYIFWIVSITLLMTQLFGLTYQLFWPHVPWLEQQAYRGLIVISNIAIIAFVRSFLKLAESIPLIDKFLKILIGIGVLIILSSITDFWIFNTEHIYSGVVVIVLTLVTFWRIKQGFKPARFFTVSFAFLDFCILVTLFRIYLFSTSGDINVIAIAVIVQSVFFAIAIQDKFLMIQAQKQVDQLDLTEKLESAVSDKTMELQLTNQALLEAKKAADSANIAKSEFLANISHELRNPMHHILSYSKFGITKVDAPKEKMTHYMSQIRKSAERLKLLLDDLLDLSKLESGMLKYAMIENSFIHLLNNSLEEYQQALDEKDLKIDLNWEYHPVPFLFDYLRINQIMHNLLNNAIKYSPSKGLISIRISQNEEARGVNDASILCVDISDEGPGIPQNEFDSIFDKFSQSSLTKTGAGGTGLGLSICKEIVAAHGGDIWARNNSKGGATFTFTLPETRN